MECNDIGQVRGVPYFQCINDGSNSQSSDMQQQQQLTQADWSSSIPIASSRPAASSRPTKKRKKSSSNNSSPKLISNGKLNDAERSQLHVEIYEYLSWLSEELSGLEKSESGQRKILRKSGIKVLGIHNILAKFENTFQDVREYKKNKQEQQENEQKDAEDAATPNTDSEKENDTRKPPLPMLESTLRQNLRQVVDDIHEKEAAEKRRMQQEQQSSDGDIAPDNSDFDYLYTRLAAYHAKHKSAAVPVRYKEGNITLGSWVSKLRSKRKSLQLSGMEYEKDHDPGYTVEEFTASSQARLGLSLYIPETDETNAATVSGAIITEIKPECLFKDRIKVGDKLMTIDGVAIKTVDDLQIGKDNEQRVFGIAVKKGKKKLEKTSLTEERMVSLARCDDPCFMPWQTVESHLDLLSLYLFHICIYAPWQRHASTPLTLYGQSKILERSRGTSI